MTQIGILGVVEALGAACAAMVPAASPEVAGGPATGGIAGGVVEAGPWWVMLIPLLPLLAAVLAGLMAMVPAMRRSKLPAWMSVGMLGASFALTLMMFVKLSGGTSVTVAWEWIHFSWGDGPGESFRADFGFYIDSLTCLWMLFVTGLATLIALYASEYMVGDVGLGYCRFFGGFNLFVFSMACLVMGDNLMLLYLGWEGVGLCSYLLIGYFYKKPSAVAAAKKAFIFNRIGDLGLALGVMLTFVHFGTVRYAELFPMVEPYIEMLQSGQIDQIPFNVQLIPVLFMIGAFGKSAQLPLFVWLPDAMEGPTPVSALIHAATMVTAGLYLIARTYPLFQVSEIALPIIAWVGTITALVAATIGMAVFDIKRVMAYSTVSQLGYMFAGFAFLTSGGAAFHVVTHAFFKATLFLCCGAVMHGFAGQLDLRRLSGVARMKGWGIVGIAMFIGCLNLAGFPFSAGFFSKDMILAEAFVTPGPGYRVLGWILIGTAGLTAYYTFRVFFRVFVGPKDCYPGDEYHDDGNDGHGGFHPHAPGWAVNTVLSVLALLAIASAGLAFVGEHGWVDRMVGQSTAASVGTAAFIEPAEAHADEHDEAATDSHGDETSTATADDAGDGEHETAHATLFGQNPHTIMYFISGIVGITGIAIAFVLHFLGRTSAAHARADGLAAALGPVARWARHKWYVDELYDFLIRTPLRVLSYIFYLIDKLIVDGLVDLFGGLPRAIGRGLRPTQSGQLHGYAVGMAGGMAILLVIVLVLSL